MYAGKGFDFSRPYKMFFHLLNLGEATFMKKLISTAPFENLWAEKTLLA